VKTGTEAEFKAGLISTDDGVNVVVEVNYSGSVGAEGVGVEFEKFKVRASNPKEPQEQYIDCDDDYIKE
jgi:hypothetical protein